jgi:DNA-binding Lrp family transcriptional regulator
VPLDKIDNAILACLREDGRLTNQRLSELVNLSPSAALARVKKLEREGYIKGYHAAIDEDRIAPRLIIYAEVSLSSQAPRDLARFEAHLQTIPEIISAALVSGPCDYLLTIAAADIQSWQTLADQITADQPVARFTSLVRIKRVKGE